MVIKEGLNANIAEQLLELSESLVGRGVEVTFSFPNKAVRDLRVTPGPFVLDGIAKQRLRLFSELLTAPQIFNGQISAKVVRCSAEPGQGALIREIALMTLEDPDINFLFWDRKLKHDLTSETEYQRAHERMASGKIVKLEGRFRYERGFIKAETLRIIW